MPLEKVTIPSNYHQSFSYSRYTVRTEIKRDIEQVGIPGHHN